MSAQHKQREHLRTEPTERLPRMLRIYSGDPEAVKLIEKEIQSRASKTGEKSTQ